MRVALIGLSHNTAPIELRERYAHETRDLEVALAKVRSLPGVEEVVIVSTCNRVEYYVAGAVEPTVLNQQLKLYLQTFSGLKPSDLESHLYAHQGQDALQHLFRVASSLDSMVLGEPQILGQVKDAFRAAEEAGTARGALGRSFQKAFSVAKRVRTETGIAENAVSMSFAAVELGREIFDTLHGRKVLLVGAGKMAGLAAKHLMASGVESVRVASRSLQSAARLAEEIGAQASSLTDLPMLLQEADIVISSTAAPHAIIDKKMMSKVIRKRRYRSILLVDIAVPRDVDPQVGELDNVFVYDVDDLQQVLELNRAERQKEADAAEVLIEDELSAYARWVKSQQVVPVIKALRQHAMSIVEREMARTVKGLPTDAKVHKSVRAMGTAIVNKMLHPVQQQLKEAGASGDPQAMVDTLMELFELEVDLAEQDEPAESEPSANVLPLRPAKGNE